MSESHSTCAVEYRPIPGFPRYRVGNDGSVWCRNTAGEIRWKRRKYSFAHGYPIISLWRHCRPSCFKVHRLVLEAFVGPRQNGQECRHIDGNKLNCSLSNLVWGTPTENCKDKDLHGRLPKGSRIKNAILTENDVREIRRRNAAGETYAALGKAFGVCPSNIYSVVKRRNWKHVA